MYTFRPGTSESTLLESELDGIFMAALNNDVTFLLNITSIDINAPNHAHLTALDIATCAGNLAFVQHLLNLGARVDIAYNGCTPLHLAATLDDVKMIKLLLPYYTQETINIQDQQDGNTPLHLFIEYSNEAVDTKKEMIELFVHHGANMNLQNFHGTTVMDMVNSGEHNIIENLQINEAISDVNDINRDMTYITAVGAAAILGSTITTPALRLIKAINNNLLITDENNSSTALQQYEEYSWAAMSLFLVTASVIIMCVCAYIYNIHYNNEVQAAGNIAGDEDVDLI